MGTGPLARSWTSIYRYPSTPNPLISFSRNAGTSMSFTNSRMPSSNMSAMYFNPDYHLVSTSDNLTRPSPPLLPFFPLMALANTLLSLCLQLIKATVPAESYMLSIIFHRHLYFPAMSTTSNQVGATLFPSF